MMTRWNYKLDTYDHDIVHRPGRFHNNADALSRITRRCPRPDCPECQLLRAKQIKDQCPDHVASVNTSKQKKKQKYSGPTRKSQRLVDKAQAQQESTTRQQSSATSPAQSPTHPTTRHAVNKSSENPTHRQAVPTTLKETKRQQPSNKTNAASEQVSCTVRTTDDDREMSPSNKTVTETSGTAGNSDRLPRASEQADTYAGRTEAWSKQKGVREWIREQELDPTLKTLIDLKQKFPDRRIPNRTKGKLTHNVKKYLPLWHELSLSCKSDINCE